MRIDVKIYIVVDDEEFEAFKESFNFKILRPKINKEVSKTS